MALQGREEHDAQLQENIPLFESSATVKIQLYFPTLATEYLMSSQILLHHKQPA